MHVSSGRRYLYRLSPLYTTLISPAMVSVASVAPYNPTKEGRQLACRLCQKRKKKCNRKKPMFYVHQGAASKNSQSRDKSSTSDIYPAQSRLSAKRTSASAQKEVVNKGSVGSTSMVRRAAAA
ncbi:hypothetical protein V8C37DRAFT_391328 [Trichoderma ceciliae]